MAPDRIRVFLYASDPVSQLGIAGLLRARPEIMVVDDGDVDGAEVAVLVVEAVTEESTRVLRAIQRNGCPKVLMIVKRARIAGRHSLRFR